MATWLLLTISACSNPNAEAPPPENPPPAEAALLLHPDDLMAVGVENYISKLALNGTLSAKLQATIRTKVSGVVEQRLVNEGQLVKEGQTLLTLDTVDIRLRLAERKAFVRSQKAAAKQAKVELDNAMRLQGEGFISATGLAKAQAAHDAAIAQLQVSQAQLEQVAQQLQDHSIKAPFDGLVGEVRVQKGDKVSPDAPVLSLVDLKILQLRATASASQVQMLAPGLQAQVFAEGYPAPLTARVIGVAPSTTGGTRSVPVILEMDNPEQKVQSGLFAQALVSVAQPIEAIFVPATAIHEQLGQSIVYRLEDGKVQMAQVETGTSRPGPDGQILQIEIRSGLASGDQIIASNLGPLEVGREATIQKVN